LGAALAVLVGVLALRSHWADEEERTIRPKGKPSNVVIVLLDTLRPDYLGVEGYEPETAPFVTRLAEESTVFTRAFSTSSWTAPSTASLFTSTYSTVHGVTTGFFAHRRNVKQLKEEGAASISINRIPDDLTTLPEHFSAQGYTTFGVSANRNIGREIGFKRGFDFFNGGKAGTYTRSADAVFKDLKKWHAEIARSEPYLLYLHLIDVHKPYRKRQPYWSHFKGDTYDNRRRYLSEIGFVDAYLEKIYDAYGRDEDTIFILLSDHGEEFLDHGGTDHGSQLYRELTQVLMLVHSRGSGVLGQRVDVNVSLIDLFPTLIDLCGLPPLEKLQGTSLASVLRRDPGAGAVVDRLRERTIFSHREHEFIPEQQFWAAMYQHWKLYEPWKAKAELYDHRVDTAEKFNVIDANGKVADALAARLATFKRDSRDTSAFVSETPLDESLLEHLESLGYVE
jgi:arylsulfatase A-like enzyme